MLFVPHFLAKSGSWIDFGGIEKMMREKDIATIWRLVLAHGASWSLVAGEDAEGSAWQLVAPCARSAVADISLLDLDVFLVASRMRNAQILAQACLEATCWGGARTCE